ncbi:hypothetical protein HELRODRAFT_168710 [Helobdella robusta]|uniref:Coiled-coil domain-containing protein 172 n=1 Tax=Helobdella robusta TaxID=6412 RepID=T1F0V9_HELRO|nr:hypothetical protein HELRODRAFT_168710 [Helobdella robusta]ESO08803.1 hypothetical protein HELRODRAFT_168710 [Helobdella robusta]
MASADLDNIFTLIESSEKLVEAKKRELVDVIQKRSLCNENLRKIRQENAEKASKLKSLELTERAIEDEKNEFFVSVESFLSKFDISGEGIRVRRKELKEKSVQMQAEKSKLIIEIDQLETVHEKVLHLKELQAKYEFKISETKRLEALKDELTKFPDNDSDFKRISNNLKALREKDIKGLCENLAKDLECLELQYNLYYPFLGD